MRRPVDRLIMRQMRSSLRAGGLRRGEPVGLLVAGLLAGLSADLSTSAALSDELGELGGRDEAVDAGADGASKTALGAVPAPAPALGAAAAAVVVVVSAVSGLAALAAPPLGPNKKFLAWSLPCVNVLVVNFSVPLALASLSLSDPPDLCTDDGTGGDVESSLCGESMVAPRKMSLSRLKLRSVPVAAARVTSEGRSWARNRSAGVMGAAVAGRRLVVVVVGGMSGGRPGESCSGAVEAARLFLAAGDAKGGRAGDSGAGARSGEGWRCGCGCGCGLALTERLDRVTRRAGSACWACSSCGTGVAEALALRVLEAGPVAAASSLENAALDGGAIRRFLFSGESFFSGEAFFSGDGGGEASSSDGGGRKSSPDPTLNSSTLSLTLSRPSLGLSGAGTRSGSGSWYGSRLTLTGPASGPRWGGSWLILTDPASERSGYGSWLILTEPRSEGPSDESRSASPMASPRTLRLPLRMLSRGATDSEP